MRASWRAFWFSISSRGVVSDESTRDVAVGRTCHRKGYEDDTVSADVIFDHPLNKLYGAGFRVLYNAYGVELVHRTGNLQKDSPGRSMNDKSTMSGPCKSIHTTFLENGRSSLV